MRSLALVGLVLLVGACAVSPVPIASGDVCHNCKQAITEPRLAAEAIARDGTVMKFKGVSCLAEYMAKHREPMSALFVTDYASGRLIRPETAMYVRAVVDPESRAMEYFAFRDVKEAVAFGDQHSMKPIDWPRVMQAITS